MLSDPFLRALLARESGEAVIPLVRVRHPDWSQPLRYVRSWQALDHQGETFLPAGFDLGMPDEDGSDEPAMIWTTGSVDREIVRRLSEYTEGIEVDVILVSSDRPDVAEVSWSLELAAWQADALTVTGTLSIAPILVEAASRRTFNAALFPGLF